MVSSIDVLREEIGGAKQAYDTDAYRSEIPGICYGMAVRALHEDTITPEDFAALVGDGTVEPVFKERRVSHSNRDIHRGSYKHDDPGDVLPDHHTYNAELVAAGVGLVGQGYWPPDDNEPYE